MTDNIVQFPDLNAPDAETVTRDEYGRLLYTYIASYRRADGRQYSFHFPAYDDADAAEAINGMNAGIELDGKLYATVPT